jgi:hypothetical protein
MLAAGIGMSPPSQAAGVSPVSKQAQSKLAILGFDAGAADGILGRHTITAIKAFPADPKECRLKRPRRTEDPTDGTHCLVNKTMQQNLVGKGT